MARKTYRVVGNHAVFEHQPGSTFTAQLGAVQERQLIRGGHIQVVATTEPQVRQAAKPPETTKEA